MLNQLMLTGGMVLLTAVSFKGCVSDEPRSLEALTNYPTLETVAVEQASADTPVITLMDGTTWQTNLTLKVSSDGNNVILENVSNSVLMAISDNIAREAVTQNSAEFDALLEEVASWTTEPLAPAMQDGEPVEEDVSAPASVQTAAKQLSADTIEFLKREKEDWLRQETLIKNDLKNYTDASDNKVWEDERFESMCNKIDGWNASKDIPNEDKLTEEEFLLLNGVIQAGISHSVIRSYSIKCYGEQDHYGLYQNGDLLRIDVEATFGVELNDTFPRPSNTDMEEANEGKKTSFTRKNVTDMYFDLKTGKRVDPANWERGVLNVSHKEYNQNMKVEEAEAYNGSPTVCIVSQLDGDTDGKSERSDQVNEVISQVCQEFSARYGDYEGKHITKSYPVSVYSEDGGLLMKATVNIDRHMQDGWNMSYINHSRYDYGNILSVLASYRQQWVTDLSADVTYYTEYGLSGEMISLPVEEDLEQLVSRTDNITKTTVITEKKGTPSDADDGGVTTNYTEEKRIGIQELDKGMVIEYVRILEEEGEEEEQYGPGISSQTDRLGSGEPDRRYVKKLETPGTQRYTYTINHTPMERQFAVNVDLQTGKRLYMGEVLGTDTLARVLSNKDSYFYFMADQTYDLLNKTRGYKESEESGVLEYYHYRGEDGEYNITYDNGDDVWTFQRQYDGANQNAVDYILRNVASQWWYTDEEIKSQDTGYSQAFASVLELHKEDSEFQTLLEVQEEYRKLAEEDRAGEKIKRLMDRYDRVYAAAEAMLGHLSSDIWQEDGSIVITEEDQKLSQNFNKALMDWKNEVLDSGVDLENWNQELFQLIEEGRKPCLASKYLYDRKRWDFIDLLNYDSSARNMNLYYSLVTGEKYSPSEATVYNILGISEGEESYKFYAQSVYLENSVKYWTDEAIKNIEQDMEKRKIAESGYSKDYFQIYSGSWERLCDVSYWENAGNELETQFAEIIAMFQSNQETIEKAAEVSESKRGENQAKYPNWILEEGDGIKVACLKEEYILISIEKAWKDKWYQCVDTWEKYGFYLQLPDTVQVQLGIRANRYDAAQSSGRTYAALCRNGGYESTNFISEVQIFEAILLGGCTTRNSDSSSWRGMRQIGYGYGLTPIYGERNFDDLILQLESGYDTAWFSMFESGAIFRRGEQWPRVYIKESGFREYGDDLWSQRSQMCYAIDRNKERAENWARILDQRDYTTLMKPRDEEGIEKFMAEKFGQIGESGFRSLLSGLPDDYGFSLDYQGMISTPVSLYLNDESLIAMLERLDGIENMDEIKASLRNENGQYLDVSGMMMYLEVHYDNKEKQMVFVIPYEIYEKYSLEE